jgi:peptidoglycan glycosyltransferase
MCPGGGEIGGRMSVGHSYSSGWRDIQERLQRKARKKFFRGKLPTLLLYAGLACLILGAIFFAISHWSVRVGESGSSHSDTATRIDALSESRPRQELPDFLKDLNPSAVNLEDRFVVERGGVRYHVESCINPALQDYILALLEHSRSLQAAVVVLNPHDGRVLAMASYDPGGKGKNLCLKADYPAASLFKIVSAAAALETAGFTPNQPVYFNGRKHTLYKRQLEDSAGPYSSETSLRKAFASSINSVFGKLGMHYLGQGVLSFYAEKFYFNRVIPFELPVSVSTVQVPDTDFGLAEVASGFNKKTLISPLHAALLASAIANNGIMMAPRLIDRVLSESGEVLFRSRPVMLAATLSRGTAQDLKVLMRDTVEYGTCRESFRKFKRKKVFRGIDLGAKTGTINDMTDRFKYDWVTAFALPPKGAKPICIAVLIVHGKNLGIRANELSGYIINYYLTS